MAALELRCPSPPENGVKTLDVGHRPLTFTRCPEVPAAESRVPRAQKVTFHMAGDEVVEGFRRSLDESDICMMADAAVAMEEGFLLDIISDIDPTASVYVEQQQQQSNRRKSARQVAQRKRPDNLQADVQKIHSELHALQQHHHSDNEAASPSSSMSEVDTSSCASSSMSGESSEWTTVPMVTPAQMFALGNMVKAQRSGSSLASFSSAADAPAGG